MTVEPQRECPRWDRCSVNHCPLDPEQDRRLSDPGDKEPKCTLGKARRLKIGSQYPEDLPKLGLTPREWAARELWRSLPLDLRMAQVERMKLLAKKQNLKKTGQNDKL